LWRRGLRPDGNHPRSPRRHIHCAQDGSPFEGIAAPRRPKRLSRYGTSPAALKEECVIHWSKRPIVALTVVALLIVVAALGGGIHWDALRSL